MGSVTKIIYFSVEGQHQNGEENDRNNHGKIT
jgi:hypothetical protein